MDPCHPAQAAPPPPPATAPPPVEPEPLPRAAGRSGRDPQSGVADVTQLLSLSEESVMQNTMVRFSRDEIYTYVGSLLVAVNPYKRISGMYGEAAMAKFSGRGLLNNPPHIYAIAEEAIRKARHGGGAQSLIISGESGAGKTETNKLALAYIVWRSQGGKGVSMLTTRILQANPLLETLGNAKTARNSNSSRFGKCVRLGTHPETGELLGGVVQTYLLEKSRVISFSEQERNFHAFYQLLAAVAAVEPPSGGDAKAKGGMLSRIIGAGADAAAPAASAAAAGAAGGAASADALAERLEPLRLASLGLGGDATAYALLARARDTRARGIDDLAAFDATVTAMRHMAISTDEMRRLFGLLATLLHLSNVSFDDGKDGNAQSAQVRDRTRARAAAAASVATVSPPCRHRTSLVTSPQLVLHSPPPHASLARSFARSLTGPTATRAPTSALSATRPR